MKIKSYFLYRSATLIIATSLFCLLKPTIGYSYDRESAARVEAAGLEMSNEPNENPEPLEIKIVEDAISEQTPNDQNDSLKRSTFLSAINLEYIINLGKMLWAVIKGGEPVVNIHTDLATAVPQGITDWQALAGWQAPIAKPYSFHWKLFGQKVVTFNYSVLYTHGGNYNAVGKYLTNVTVVPTKVKVFMGYKFSSDVVVNKVTNIGTKENPVGALEFVLKWTLVSYVAHHENSSTFYVTGAGDFNKVSFTR